MLTDQLTTSVSSYAHLQLLIEYLGKCNWRGFQFEAHNDNQSTHEINHPILVTPMIPCCSSEKHFKSGQFDEHEMNQLYEKILFTFGVQHQLSIIDKVQVVITRL
jgi:hypothetical protein